MTGFALLVIGLLTETRLQGAIQSKELATQQASERAVGALQILVAQANKATEVARLETLKAKRDLVKLEASVLPREIPMGGAFPQEIEKFPDVPVFLSALPGEPQNFGSMIIETFSSIADGSRHPVTLLPPSNFDYAEGVTIEYYAQDHFSPHNSQILNQFEKDTPDNTIAMAQLICKNIERAGHIVRLNMITSNQTGRWPDSAVPHDAVIIRVGPRKDMAKELTMESEGFPTQGDDDADKFFEKQECDPEMPP